MPKQLKKGEIDWELMKKMTEDTAYLLGISQLEALGKLVILILDRGQEVKEKGKK